MKSKKGFLVICLIFAAALLTLMSPIFAISQITVTGNDRFTDNEILDMANIKSGMNIFRFRYNNSQNKLLENTYISYAEIETILPDKVVIEVVEREICGYVPYMGTYLYIDQDGIVLENKPVTGDARPIVAGLRFNEFSISKPLVAENKNSFEVVTIISRLLLYYDYLDFVSEINIADPENIHLYVDNIDVSFGDVTEADKKMRHVIEIIKKIPEGDKGVLHIENMTETPYFTYTP